MTIYHIPVNYTDAGRLFGLFEIRNAIEAVLIAVPCAFFCFFCLPFTITAKIIATIIVLVPSAGFALIGVNDESLTQFLTAWFRWRRERKILTYRGTTE